MKRWAAILGLLLWAVDGAADGGRVRLRQDAGQYAITVFTAPEPLTVGAADVSVLVQDRTTGEVVLDADVAVSLTAPGASEGLSRAATPGSNRLLKAAAVNLPAAGLWRLEVAVRRDGNAATVSGSLPVEAGPNRLAVIWPFLAAPPLAVALFALRGRLRRRSSRG